MGAYTGQGSSAQKTTTGVPDTPTPRPPFQKPTGPRPTGKTGPCCADSLIALAGPLPSGSPAEARGPSAAIAPSIAKGSDLPRPPRRPLVRDRRLRCRRPVCEAGGPAISDTAPCPSARRTGRPCHKAKPAPLMKTALSVAVKVLAILTFSNISPASAADRERASSSGRAPPYS